MRGLWNSSPIFANDMAAVSWMASRLSKATIESFYAAFARLDGDTMQACYAPSAHFEDEVFTLDGVRADRRHVAHAVRGDEGQARGRAHWKLDVSQVTDRSAHWEAHYLFSATGRKVLNRIDAEFEFDADGLIVRHRDRFDFWAWSRQALGLPGLLLGWTPLPAQQGAHARRQRT